MENKLIEELNKIHQVNPNGFLNELIIYL